VCISGRKHKTTIKTLQGVLKVLTDIDNNSIWNWLWIFADIFHAQKATLHTIETLKCKKVY